MSAQPPEPPDDCLAWLCFSIVCCSWHFSMSRDFRLFDFSELSTCRDLLVLFDWLCLLLIGLPWHFPHFRGTLQVFGVSFYSELVDASNFRFVALGVHSHSPPAIVHKRPQPQPGPAPCLSWCGLLLALRRPCWPRKAETTCRGRLAVHSPAGPLGYYVDSKATL